MTEWISIKDSLPRDCEYVIGFGDYDINITQFKQTTDKRHKIRNGYFIDDSSFDLVDITHWMPLPKPPEIE